MAIYTVLYLAFALLAIALCRASAAQDKHADELEENEHENS